MSQLLFVTIHFAFYFICRQSRRCLLYQIFYLYFSLFVGNPEGVCFIRYFISIFLYLQVIQKLSALLDKLLQWIEEIPPTDQPQRFGNKAFRDFYKKLKDVSNSSISQFIKHFSIFFFLRGLCEKFANLFQNIQLLQCFLAPLVERGLYCNHLVCPSVRSHFR